MTAFIVLPHGPEHFPVRGYNEPSIQTREQAAIRYGQEYLYTGDVTVDDAGGDYFDRTRFRLSLHTAPGWGAGTSWHSVIATEIAEEQETK